MMQNTKDIYKWRVVYNDGTSIDEDEENGFTNDVDKGNVASLFLLPLHRVDVPPGCHAVFFRRRSIEINLMSDEENNRPTVYCIGWKCGEEGTYLFVFDDGSAFLTNDLQAV